MHFARGCFPIDSIGVEGVYLGVGQNSARIFALAVSLGLDVRVVAGYVYQSATPVEDPEEVQRRVAHFQERAGFYYRNWDELYGRRKVKMLDAIASMKDISFPSLGDLDPIEVVTEARGKSTSWSVIENYHRLINEYFVVWQYHFEFLNLGYGAYITLFQFCKNAFPQISDQAISRMVAGVDVLTFRPDDELRRLARLALDLGVADVVAADRPVADTFALLRGEEAGRSWLGELESVRDPWFNYSAEYGFAHNQDTWNTDLLIPLKGIARYVARLSTGEDIARPIERLRQERDELVAEYRGLLSAEEAAQFDELVALAHKVFPYIEEHNIYIEHWSLSVFWRKARELGDFLVSVGFLAKRDDMFLLNRFEVDQVLADVVQSWAINVPARGSDRWRAEVEHRRAVMAALQAQVPPPACGTPPEQVTDPFAVMNFGITTERVRTWLGQSDGAGALTGVPALLGIVEGPVRVLRSEKDLLLLRRGEILVAPITAPSWAPAFAVAVGVITDTGGMMSHAAIVCREYGIPAVVGTGYATAWLRTGQSVRVDGNTGEVTVLTDAAEAA